VHCLSLLRRLVSPFPLPRLPAFVRPSVVAVIPPRSRPASIPTVNLHRVTRRIGTSLSPTAPFTQKFPSAQPRSRFQHILFALIESPPFSESYAPLPAAALVGPPRCFTLLDSHSSICPRLLNTILNSPTCTDLTDPTLAVFSSLTTFTSKQ
jgi:hypothetical protein